MPEVSPLPAASGGQITFGCLNNLAKLNEQVLALWGEVLRAVPDSQTAGADRGAGRRAQSRALRRTVREARHRAVPAGTARLRRRSIRSPASYAEIDIALDPFPFCGGMTSLEALWLGVPVITLAGETIASRQSASMLMNLGLPELIAEHSAQYVACRGAAGAAICRAWLRCAAACASASLPRR